jgi:hypothetical protein
MDIFVISKGQTFRICATFLDPAKFSILVIHLIRPALFWPDEIRRKKLLCKVEFTLLKSQFFPAKFSKIQEKNLAGKNTLQKSEFYFAKE